MVNKAIICTFYACILHVGVLHADESAPSIEFLEYLADVNTSNDDWLDPLEMKNIASNDKTDDTQQEKRDE